MPCWRICAACIHVCACACVMCACVMKVFVARYSTSFNPFWMFYSRSLRSYEGPLHYCVHSHYCSRAGFLFRMLLAENVEIHVSGTSTNTENAIPNVCRQNPLEIYIKVLTAQRMYGKWTKNTGPALTSNWGCLKTWVTSATYPQGDYPNLEGTVQCR